MPAQFWGHLDPEREELQNALLRAQTRQMQMQTSLAEQLGAERGPAAAAGALGGAIEDDELEWEQLEFQKKRLEEETKLAKAQQLILEREMTLKEEEAQAPFTMGMGGGAEMLVGRDDYKPMLAPLMRVGTSAIDPFTGDPMYESPITAMPEEEVLRPDTGEVLKPATIRTPTGTLITPGGEVIFSEPHVVTSGSQINVLDRISGDVINTVDIAQVPKGFQIRVDAKGNVYTLDADTGEVELAQESAYYDMEYEQKDRALKVQQFGYEVQSKGYDIQKYGFDTDRYVADKGYDKVIDHDRFVQDIQDGINVTTIQKQQLINKAETEKNEVQDRRTDAMLRGYDVEEYGYDIKRFVAELGYDESVHRDLITQAIHNSDNASAEQRQQLIYDLGVLTNESAERRNTATIEANDRKLTSQRYLAGYVPQTAEEALGYITRKAKIEAKYAPYTQPNDMNREDAKEWLENVALIDLFFEKGKTDEQIRLANIKAAVGRSADEVLKHSALATMGEAEMGELGKALLEFPFVEAGRAGELAARKLELAQSIHELEQKKEAGLRLSEKEERTLERAKLEFRERELVSGEEEARERLDVRLEELGAREEELTFQRRKWAGEQLSREEERRLGWANLDVRIDELDVQREELGFRREEARLERQGEALGEEREDTEYLMDLMLRATATHKPTYGIYGYKDKVAAAETLQTFITMDTSIAPELKMKWLNATPHLMGISLARELLKETERPYFEWWDKMFNQALKTSAELGGLPVPTPTYKGTSLIDIIRDVNEAGSVRKGKRVAKKYGLTWDEYLDIAEEYLSKEVTEAVEQRTR